jgi:cyclic nucleotide gated channel
MTFIDCGHGDRGINNLSDQTKTLWSNNPDAIACLNTSSTPFHYGIYVNAVPLTFETNILNKYIYSLFWGFQVPATYNYMLN